MAAYASATVVASAVGSTFTWRSDDGWADANPLVAGPWMAAYSLGPALFIVAAVRVGLVGATAIATTAAVGIVAMWWLFSSNDSSTSALVFLSGWWFGIPLAAGVLAVANWHDRHRSASGDRDGSPLGPGVHRPAERAR
jgi:hypothetical protein